VVSGELTAPELSGGFRFYVNPERPALYSVMRYRLRSPAHVRDEKPATEKFFWVEHPGGPLPMRCFELLDSGAAGTTAEWRELLAGTPEYVNEVRTLISVLAEQNRESRRQGAPR